MKNLRKIAIVLVTLFAVLTILNLENTSEIEKNNSVKLDNNIVNICEKKANDKYKEIYLKYRDSELANEYHEKVYRMCLDFN